MKKRTLLKSLAAAAVVTAGLGAGTLPSLAQEVTLRMHQFLPPQATVPAKVLIPWAEKIEKESDGRIKIDVFSAMALGGTPPQLIDQARDGVVDIVWTLPGYSPGRFPRAEVFELPFMMTNAEAGSRAYWELFESDMKDNDFKDLKILGTWMHGPGMFHVQGDGIAKLEDMEGKKLRGPTRVINGLLSQMGATPVGMPVPAIPEALSKGVIDGTVIPWEVTPALKVPELVNTHTEFSGDRALYTAVFVLAMNKAKYDSLPDDLKKVIDDNSGLEFSAFAGRTMQEFDAPGRAIAEKAGNKIIVLDEAEVARWKEASKPVIDNWISEMDAKGIDGRDLYERAQAAIAKNTN
ncbi:TRAP transporter substrate-binding protein [Hoeflea sp. TYP-13]|uniref:TRAP transporter substrate-binding protein n=1 Tax=Hoeflea sp. TYP-13 TaxID=3230023 RepID=UPI0034C5F81C